MPPYLILILAVLTETIGTTALQASHQFTKLVPSIVVVVAYGLSFFLLSVTLKYMPVGVVYALWSGMGIAFIAIIADRIVAASARKAQLRYQTTQTTNE